MTSRNVSHGQLIVQHISGISERLYNTALASLVPTLSTPALEMDVVTAFLTLWSASCSGTNPSLSQASEQDHQSCPRQSNVTRAIWKPFDGSMFHQRDAKGPRSDEGAEGRANLDPAAITTRNMRRS